MKKGNPRLRQTYQNMKSRCYAPYINERTARAYRDKGIRVCEEWLADYHNFEKWALSHGYAPGLSIDRIDPNGNYCPENCRWVTKSENCARARQSGGTVEIPKATESHAAARIDEKAALISLIQAVSSVPEDREKEACAFLEGLAEGISEGLKMRGTAEKQTLADLLKAFSGLDDSRKSDAVTFMQGAAWNARLERERRRDRTPGADRAAQ